MNSSRVKEGLKVGIYQKHFLILSTKPSSLECSFHFLVGTKNCAQTPICLIPMSSLGLLCRAKRCVLHLYLSTLASIHL